MHRNRRVRTLNLERRLLHIVRQDRQRIAHIGHAQRIATQLKNAMRRTLRIERALAWTHLALGQREHTKLRRLHLIRVAQERRHDDRGGARPGN